MNTHQTRMTAVGLALFVTVAVAPPAPAEEDVRCLSRDIFQQLIEIDTTEATGSTTTAARALAARLAAWSWTSTGTFRRRFPGSRPISAVAGDAAARNLP